jgi:hypothetical protein
MKLKVATDVTMIETPEKTSVEKSSWTAFQVSAVYTTGARFKAGSKTDSRRILPIPANETAE